MSPPTGGPAGSPGLRGVGLSGIPLRSSLEALALLLDPVVFVLPPDLLADRTPSKRTGLRTCMPSRTYHAELAAASVERRPSRAEDLECLVVVEDVLLEGLAVDVASGQNARHEGVEVVGLRRRLCRLSAEESRGEAE